MTEGPTARYKAWKIYLLLRGRVVKDIKIRSSKIKVDPNKLIGKRFLGFDTFGKNIIFIFDGYCVRIHLMMYGTIHVYNEREKLKKPEKLIRLAIEFDDGQRMIVYNAPIIEIDHRDKLYLRIKKDLGEDPLRVDWDINRAIRLIKRDLDKSIGEVLLDQKVIAGVGNILRNEILFRARIHPDRLVKDLSDDEVRRIVEISADLMREWLRCKVNGERIGPTILIYGKSKKPCPICGRLIKFYRQKPHNRRTYVCETCQK